MNKSTNGTFNNKHSDAITFTNVNNTISAGSLQNTHQTSFHIEETLNLVEEEKRKWSGNLQFLMACIATSVGLGNIWRFPYTAFENGGGAFLIPYVIVLIFVGRPIYYLEGALGQFTSRSCVGVCNMVPALKGLGFGQALVAGYIVSYYGSLMALTLHYLFSSFKSELPWSYCWSEWQEPCIPIYSSNKTINIIENTGKIISGSAELYFRKQVLNEASSIENGIGIPSWQLSLCLAISWASVYIVLYRGVRDIGRAIYFLAIFPYVVMLFLLIRSVTLEGAYNGIIFFITPNWKKLWEPSVWYAAITQCFFSLGVCLGPIITYGSTNNFHRPIYRDVMIVTTMDTFTSFMAGCTIFGILGNLAHELGTEDIASVVRGGTGLAFISYPDALARFDIVPQFFSILFFVMMYVLALGTGMSLCGSILVICCDYLPNTKTWILTLIITATAFILGHVYITPGGQWFVSLVDFYGGQLITIIIGVLEISSIFWIYGLWNILNDFEFMLGKRPGIYYRLCWLIITPSLMIIILVYTAVTYTPPTYDGLEFPTYAYIIGWIISGIFVAQLIGWIIFYVITKKRGQSLLESIKIGLIPTKKWGPFNDKVHAEWKEFTRKKKSQYKGTLRELFFD